MFFRSKRSRRESGEGATTLQFHLKRTSNSPCVGGVHLQPTFWKAVTWWQRKTAGWHGSGEGLITAQKDPVWWSTAMLVDANRSEKKAAAALSSSSGLHHCKHTIRPSLCSGTPTDELLLPPSCHRTHKNEVRTRAHIRRAGGSTLSGVRNNSFWPSTACALKWSPWVAAYQRAAAMEWVVGITQPGFRTYTGHSKGPAHWAREIHGEPTGARSCFDWDWMIKNPPPPFWWHSPTAYVLQSMHLCKRRRWSLQSAANIKLYVMYENSRYRRCSSSTVNVTASDLELHFKELNQNQIRVLV